MRKSAAVPLVITSSLALALAGCGASDGDDAQEAQYQGVCVDPNSGQRIDDDACDDDDGNGGGGSGFLWYYFLLNRPYPAVGTTVVNNNFTEGRDYVRSVPNGSSYVSGGASRSGGTVSSSSLSSAASAPTARVVSKSSSGTVTKSSPGAGTTVRGGLGGGSGAKAGS